MSIGFFSAAIFGLALGLLLGAFIGRARSRTDAQRPLDLARAEHARVEAEQARVNAEAMAARAAADVRASALQLERDRLTDQLQQASEQQQQRQAVELVVQPLTDSLKRVREQLDSVEKSRTASYAELREQVRTMGETSKQLRDETSHLVTALRAPAVRGRWGEAQLRRVIESAGMVEHCDFVEQPTINTADGVLRPDVVVKLTGGRQVVIDSKVPFLGYLDAVNARDDATRSDRLKAHARHLRQHIDDLSAKAYWQHLDPTPEFVVMFVPAEAFLQAALDEDPSLFERAFATNVVLATPSTLIALLRTIAHVWRQDRLAENVDEIHRLGKELHLRLATMGGHVSRLGRDLDSAVQSYNRTVSSLESRVLVTARRLGELQGAEGDDHGVASPEPVEATVRATRSIELAGEPITERSA